jgi:hypothetical protein
MEKKEVPRKVKINHEAITRETRDRMATKADDAEVPEYLWLEHLVQDGKREWTDDEIMRLPSVMHTIRERCLPWWKKRTTMSLLPYVALRCENYDDGMSYKGKINLPLSVKWLESYRSWSKEKGCRLRLKWVWSEGGRDDYRKW